jgi:CT1975-like protein
MQKPFKSFHFGLEARPHDWSLANAFLKPVRATGGGDLMTASMAALGDYWGKLTAMYGEPDGAWLGVATLHPESLGGLTGKASVETVPALGC